MPTHYTGIPSGWSAGPRMNLPLLRFLAFPPKASTVAWFLFLLWPSWPQCPKFSSTWCAGHCKTLTPTHYFHPPHKDQSERLHYKLQYDINSYPIYIFFQILHHNTKMHHNTLSGICTVSQIAVHDVSLCVLDENLPALWIYIYTKLKIKTSHFSTYHRVKKLKM